MCGKCNQPNWQQFVTKLLLIFISVPGFVFTSQDEAQCRISCVMCYIAWTGSLPSAIHTRGYFYFLCVHLRFIFPMITLFYFSPLELINNFLSTGLSCSFMWFAVHLGTLTRSPACAWYHWKCVVGALVLLMGTLQLCCSNSPCHLTMKLYHHG